MSFYAALVVGSFCLGQPQEPKYTDSPVTLLDKACGLLGPESYVIDGANFKYVAAPKVPFVFVFANQRRFHSVSLRPNLNPTPAEQKMKERIEGIWLVSAIDVLPNSGGLAETLRFAMSVEDGVFSILFSCAQATFFSKLSTIGPIAELSVWYPQDADVEAVSKVPGYAGFLNQKFIPFGDFAISYMPVTHAKFGRIGLCYRVKRKVID